MTAQQTRRNIRRIQQTLGTGPVREPSPVPVAKVKKIGTREAAMKAWREAAHVKSIGGDASADGLAPTNSP